MNADDDVRKKTKKRMNNDAIVRMKKIKRIKHEQKKNATAKNKKQLDDWMAQPTLLFDTCVNACTAQRNCTPYRAAKAAQNQLLRCLSIEWARRWPKATVTLLHPGTTDTELSKPFQSFIPAEQLFSPQRAAEQLVAVLLEQTPEQSGAFLAWDGQSIDW